MAHKFYLRLTSKAFFPHRLLLLTFIFLFLFPKGGFKYADIPITWSYLLLTLLSLFYLITKKSLLILKESHILLLAFLPFQILSLLTLFTTGIESIGFSLSLFLSFFLFPWLFLSLLSFAFDDLHFERTCSLLKETVLFTAIFGLILFMTRLMTGKELHIPFLTVNWDDLHFLSEKCNFRGGTWFKLSSTFQSGLVYGIATSIFLPLFNLLEKKTWKKYLVHLALFLTLSRTIWIALLLAEILDTFYVKKLSPSSFIKFLCKGTLFALAAYTLTALMHKAPSFIYDSSLGGRVDQLETLRNWTLFGEDTPFSGIAEMTYLEILRSFGAIGLLSFLLAMTAPLWIFFSKRSIRKQNPLHKSLSSGLILYLIIAISDGALLYIPIMAFYWTATALLLKQNFSIEKNQHSHA